MARGHGREVETQLGLARAMISSPTVSSFESEHGARYSHHHQTDEQRSSRQQSRSSSRAGQTTPLLPYSPSLPPPTTTANTNRAAPDSVVGWRTYSSHTQTQHHSHGPGPEHHHSHSHSQSYSVWTSHVRSHSQTPISTPYVSRPPSPLAQYERLMSGLESDAGDAPPSYENIASGF